MKRKTIEFLRDERGATAVEYGLIAALVSVAGIASLTLMGTSLTSIFQAIGTLLSNSANAANNT